MQRWAPVLSSVLDPAGMLWGARPAGRRRTAFQGALPGQGSGNHCLLLSLDTDLIEEL